ncbi:hypothetical protein QTJ16_006525 [Diplocarpon rosae]|uniref:UBA domain-containing protein n=1 Tax=Diplocarpon rosae TaxID=946125 RepID=A0AAD9SUK9_9HELO|nr:hypothetical protein QTJ16_006525 [Diplocarpon rosae]PBP23666.1 hypothetical protein BUE80_DR005332 [Diplocarpon rosae]
MDDLNGLDWSTKPTKPNTSTGTGNYYPALRPTPPPLSNRTTPLSSQIPSFNAPSKSPGLAFPKSSTPDSFSNLVSFGSSASKSSTLTLQQQQEKLQAEKLKLEEEKRRQFDAQFGGEQSWDALGGSRSTVSAFTPLPVALAQAASPEKSLDTAEDDLFAAFSADAPVDKSSHYPPPSSGQNTPIAKAEPLDLTSPHAWEQPGSLGGLGDDDDPFGLGQMNGSSKPAPTPIPSIGEDDDFLGDLGKPVEEVRRASPLQRIVPEPEPDRIQEEASDDPWDKAVAELVDMGFSAEQSRAALTESGSGLDIQAAVGWILNDAHRQAKQKQQGGTDSRRKYGASDGERRGVSRDTRRRDAPAWQREEPVESHSRRENKSPNGESDLSKTAAAVGNNFFKTANSLWKTSQKKVQKAMNEFQQDSDPSQPKWMREAAEREQSDRRAAAEGRLRHSEPAADVTDEALMLEGGGRPPPRKARAPEPRFSASLNSSREQSPAMPKPPAERSQPRWQQTAPPDARSRVSKQVVEEQAAQAYVSPSRRKKATPQPSEPDVNIFSAPASSRSAQLPRISQRPAPAPSKPSTPIPTRPKVPVRQIPTLSPTALANSNQHRLAGTAHFKRGDYASAHQSYTSSLLSIPSSHPITIILLCNRALTSLKTGVPKSAVTDSDAALELIGLSRGDGETINLGPGDGNGSKDMREFYGKALMRKAEALEQMERWKDAGDVWKLCVEHSVGGATAIQGRSRCEKALAPKPAQRISDPKPTPRSVPRASAISDLGSRDSEAVKRLRLANANAEKADDEKFALSDKVHERIGNWKNGKEDNLRALIGSLDNVMWEGSGWKKVGMHELVVNSKVKINYMKAIGKTHPDKLPQDASTEVKMIAALVFATLNESWDKFKKQNGM